MVVWCLAGTLSIPAIFRTRSVHRIGGQNGSHFPESDQDIEAMFYRIVQSELKPDINAIKTEIQDVMRPAISEIKAEINSIKRDFTNFDIQIDDLKNRDLPQLEARLDDRIQRSVLHSLEQEVYNRKFNLVFSGIPGIANEQPKDTKANLLSFCVQYLNVPLEERDLAACHRLSSTVNAQIIARFADITQKDLCSSNAKKLHNVKLVNYPAGISPSLPPIINKLRKQIFDVRSKLHPDQKRQSRVKYLPRYPFIALYIDGAMSEPLWSKSKLVNDFLDAQ